MYLPIYITYLYAYTFNHPSAYPTLLNLIMYKDIQAQS
jgi:hypothetical protein